MNVQEVEKKCVRLNPLPSFMSNYNKNICVCCQFECLVYSNKQKNNIDHDILLVSKRGFSEKNKHL